MYLVYNIFNTSKNIILHRCLDYWVETILRTRFWRMQYYKETPHIVEPELLLYTYLLIHVFVFILFTKLFLPYSKLLYFYSDSELYANLFSSHNVFFFKYVYMYFLLVCFKMSKDTDNKSIWTYLCFLRDWTKECTNQWVHVSIQMFEMAK